jgi:subtilisin family serine protease
MNLRSLTLAAALAVLGSAPLSAWSAPRITSSIPKDHVISHGTSSHPSAVAQQAAAPKAPQSNSIAAALTETVKNWGIFNKTPLKTPSHIQALDAWKIERGSKKVVVAVIDTGVDANHKDLADNMWSDPKAKGPSQFGWNFVTNKANPMDDHGHGTHVAGIIGAVADLKNGVSGVAQAVSIMAVKYYSESNSGSVNLKNTVKAIDYAVEHGAKIINYSGGGPDFSEEEYLAIRRAEAAGVLVVAAAGNERQNTDLVQNYYYPSAYRLSNIISVAATDIKNDLLKSSNWGKTRVDVAAPGENIYSTIPGGKYGFMSGTSQATAFVSGMAALLLSKDPTLTPVQIKELILSSVDRIPQLSGKVATQGRVNAYSALLALSNRGMIKKAPRSLAQETPMALFDSLATPPSLGR